MFYHLIMHTGCNLNCKYCDKDEFIPIDEDTYDFHVPKTVQYSLEDLQQFIKEEDYVTFYGGGEPLLAIDKIKNFMDNLECKTFMIQTNGILLDKLEKEYVNKFHTILVSIDGDEEITDKNRGEGTHKKVMQNVKLIREQGFQGELIARMCISEDLNVYKQITWLLENGFDNIHWQLDAMFYSEEKTEWFKDYNQQITLLIDYWIDKMKQGKVLRLYPFLVIMDSILRNQKAKMRCGSGHSNYTITTHGKISYCPIMSEMKKYYIGNIKETKELKTLEPKEPCTSCEVLDQCGGRCLYANLTKLWSPEAEAKLCDTVKHLINSLKEKKPLVEDLIEKRIISLEDFKHLKYNGVEVIP